MPGPSLHPLFVDLAAANVVADSAHSAPREITGGTPDATPIARYEYDGRHRRKRELIVDVPFSRPYYWIGEFYMDVMMRVIRLIRPGAFLAAALSINVIGGCVEESNPDNGGPINFQELSSRDDLTALNLSHTEVTDDDLVDIARMKRLKHLDLSSTAITDSGLAHVATMTNLEYLFLSETSITDVGLESVSVLTTLRGLDLRWTRITGKGFESLSRMTGLEELYMTNVPLDRGDVKFLAHLSSLRVLDFGRTDLEDEDFAHLTDTDIVDLKVSSDLLGDEACAHIAEIQSLEKINLISSRITSDGVRTLLRMPNLINASIKASSISEDERERLRDGEPGQLIIIMP